MQTNLEGREGLNGGGKGWGWLPVAKEGGGGWEV